MNYDSKIFSEFSMAVAKKTEESILEQLNEFISRGLICLEQMRPIFVRKENADQVEVRTAVRLTLKDQEYIQELEKENELLKARLKMISEAVVSGPDQP